jgi:ADP-ribosylglycohydrolase
LGVLDAALWQDRDISDLEREMRDSVKRAATGCLLGLAIGDAMGFPTEFSDIAQIASKAGPWRTMPLPLSSGRAYVTDDTQMTLAFGQAL